MAIEIENPVETAIGAAVLAAATGFAFYAGLGGDGASGGAGYELVASFRSASGIATGADVRIAGVKVGRVARLELDPLTYKARVVLAIDGNVELTDEAWAKIDSEGLLGGAFIDLDPGAGLEVLADGDSIINTQGAVSLLDLLAKFAGSSEGNSQ